MQPLAPFDAFGFLGLPFFLLGLVVFILCIVVAVEAKNKGRGGWWIYLIVAFFSPLNLIAVIVWYVHARQNPIMNAGKPFL